MFNEVNRETLTVDINQAKTEGLLLQDSVDFLLSKLSSLSESDNELTSIEVKIIEKQLEYHKQMLEYKNDFDIQKHIMRNVLKNEIGTIFDNMHGSNISDTDLLDIECKLQQKLFNSSRDIVDSKINNNDWSLEGMGDGFLNYEIIGQFSKTNNLLNYLTLELLNNNIIIDEKRSTNNEQIKYSELSIEEINQYIKNTIKYLLSNNLDFPDNIELLVNNELIEIKLTDIQLEIENELFIENQLIEEKKLQEEKENNKEYLVNLITDLLEGNIDTEGLSFLEKKYNFVGNINDGENKGYVKLIHDFINKGYINEQFIIDLYEEGKISKILLLNYLEEDENFNYVEFIEKYGLTDKVKEITLKYSREKLGISKQISDKNILENLTLFLLTFIMIESSGYNVKNRAGASTADGNFQYVNNNGKFKDGEWYSGSFQTALTRVDKLERLKSFLPEGFFKSRFGEFYVPNNPELEKSKKPSDLSSENQTILFFLDIVENGKSIGNVQADDMMKLILSERNSWALGRIYMLLHHTDPDKKTVDVYEREKNKYYYGDKKYIAKNHY